MAVRLDHAGIAEILRSPGMHAAVRAAAETVATNVRAEGIRVEDENGGPDEVDLPVEVDSDTTDRATASVTLAHPAGMAVQAKHGTLTKAAAAAGLDVRRR